MNSKKTLILSKCDGHYYFSSPGTYDCALLDKFRQQTENLTKQQL